MSASELHHHLRLLQLEHIRTRGIGITAREHSRRDLEEEMATCRAAFVGAAVTEIVRLRAQLSGPRLG